MQCICTPHYIHSHSHSFHFFYTKFSSCSLFSAFWSGKKCNATENFTPFIKFLLINFILCFLSHILTSIYNTYKAQMQYYYYEENKIIWESFDHFKVVEWKSKFYFAWCCLECVFFSCFFIPFIHFSFLQELESAEILCLVSAYGFCIFETLIKSKNIYTTVNFF